MYLALLIARGTVEHKIVPVPALMELIKLMWMNCQVRACDAAITIHAYEINDTGLFLICAPAHPGQWITGHIIPLRESQERLYHPECWQTPTREEKMETNLLRQFALASVVEWHVTVTYLSLVWASHIACLPSRLWGNITQFSSLSRY